MNAPAVKVPAWIEPPVKRRRSYDVKVRCLPPSNVPSEHTYAGVFTSSWDAYDDALMRFPHAVRIEVKARQRAGGTL